MKKLFKKLLAVALVGAMVGFVGCKDYDDDIDALNNRLDGIENNQIKGINDQIASMQSSISSLQSAQSATQAAVETLKTTVATLTAKHDADIQDLKGADIELQAQISVLEAAIKALEAKDADLQAQIDSINETMKTMASMSWVEATLEAYATSEEVAAAIGELEAWLGEIGIRLANLESQVTELQILGDEHAKAIDAANAKIEALQAQLDKAIEDLMAWVGEQLSGYITASYFEGYMAEYTAEIVSTLETISNAIEEDYKEYTDEAVKNAVEAFKAQVVATLEEMSNAIEADRARDLADLKEQIVATLEEMSNAIEADRKRDLTALQEAIVAQLEEMSNAIEADRARDIQDALDKVVAQLEETSNAIEHDYKEYADAVVAQLRDDVVNTLMEMSAGIEADMEKLKGVIEENYTAAIQAALDQVVATLEEMSNAIEADRARDLAALKEQVVATLEEMLNAIEADYKKEIAAAIENNNGVLRAEFTEAMAELSKTLDSFIEELEKQMYATKVNVSALIERIQSIAYVPEYADHKATVPVILTMTTEKAEGDAEAPAEARVKVPAEALGFEVFAEGQTAMTFQVTPASAASKLVKLGKEFFHYEFEEVVATRAAEYGLEILDVVAGDKEGRITVIAQPTLPKEFYQQAIEALADNDYQTWAPVWEAIDFDAARSFSVALHVTAKASIEEAPEATQSDIVSNYVNLYPAADVLDGIALVSATDTLYDGESYEYEIEYDAMDKSIALLEGYELAVVVGEEITKLSELPYVAPAPEVVCNKQAYTKDGKEAELEAANFKFNNGELNNCDEVVSLAKLDKYSVGNYLETEHIYTIGAAEATFGAEVKIIKAYKTVTFEDWTYYWWYQDYLKAAEAQVEYEGSKLTVVLPVKESLLPEDVTPEQVVAYWSTKPVTVEVDGEVSEMTVTPVAYDEEKGYTLEITGWSFAEEAQEIEATCEFATIDVKFIINATMINLPKEISVEVEDAAMTYDNKLEVFKSKGESVVEALYAQVENHFADATELASSLAKDNSKVVYDATLGEGEEAVSVTPAKKHTFLNKNASYTMIRVANDGKMTAVMEVLKSDVTAADDVFNFTTTISPAYGEIAIVVTGAATIEAPAYFVKHNDVWVAKAENEYFSNVKGLWMPDGKQNPVESFSTEDVALEEAFEIVKLVDGELIPVESAEIAEQALVLDFELDGEYEGIEIDEDNLLTYNGKEEKVGVDGTLSVGALVIPKAFLEYDNYVVYGYDPIGEWTVDPTEVISTEEAKPNYSVNVVEKLSLKDVRGWELISEDAEDVVDPWIAGNNKNGFATDVSPKDVFSLSDIKVEYRIVEAATGFETDVLNGRVDVDTTTGEVTFNNLNNMALQKDLKLEVDVTVSYPWGADKKGTVTYLITK